MEYITRHYHVDLALVWALRLEEKTDQNRIVTKDLFFNLHALALVLGCHLLDIKPLL
ncbi:MAG: hypothetical protein HN978_07345 [Desulfobacula sp.]|jgi:hypothetical protein|nr:hypothetical protein [Desulfobacula sp.]